MNFLCVSRSLVARRQSLGWMLLFALTPGAVQAVSGCPNFPSKANLFDLQVTLQRYQSRTPEEVQHAAWLYREGMKSFSLGRNGKSKAVKWFLESAGCSPSVGAYAWAAESSLFDPWNAMTNTACLEGKMRPDGYAAAAYRLVLTFAPVVHEPFPPDHPEQQIRDRLMCMDAYAHRQERTPPKACESFYAEVAASC